MNELGNPNPGAKGGCSTACLLATTSTTPQRQHNRDNGDVLTALADADRCLSLGLYRAARVHALRAVRLIMAVAS